MRTIFDVQHSLLQLESILPGEKNHGAISSADHGCEHGTRAMLIMTDTSLAFDWVQANAVGRGIYTSSVRWFQEGVVNEQRHCIRVEETSIEKLLEKIEKQIQAAPAELQPA